MRWRALVAAHIALFSIPAWAVGGTSDTGVDPQLSAVKLTMQRDMQAGIKEASQLIRAITARTRLNLADRLRLAAAKRLIAEAQLRIGRYDEAAQSIEAAERDIRSASPRSELMGEVLLTKGGVYAARESYDASLSAYQAAHRTFAHRGSERNTAIALIYIATLYSDARDWATALRYLTQAEESARNDRGLLNAIHNNRGIVLHAMGRYKEAAIEIRRSLQLGAKLDQPSMQAATWRNLARNAVEMDRLGTAESAIARALALTNSSDEGSTRPVVLAISADVALRRGQIKRAGLLVDRAFSGVDPETTPFAFRDAHDTAYRTYSALGRPAEALEHLIALRRLNDEATKLATDTGAALMRARFDYANQELRIAKLRAEELRRDVAAAEVRARTARTIFTITAGATAAVIALLAVALFTIRRSRDKVRAANDDLAVTNTALGRALAAKTEFLATTSHEVRTPLNGILGMTQVMLADRALAADVRERLAVVHDAGLTMRALVDDILDVAKMEAGRLTIESASFDLAATLAGAAAIWHGQAADKGIAFAVDLADAPAAMVGDAARVRQIVFNLLSNAMKFTTAGSVRLSVTTAPDRRSVAVAVADTGIGIAPDQQAGVFDSFRQADASTTRRFGGTGLGLAICRNLAEAMGGGIALASAPDCGSTFTVTLPLVEPAAIDAPCDESPRLADALLVVDRNPIARGMWRALFAPHAAEIAFADDAATARAILHCGGVSRLLVDEASAGGQAAALLAEAAGAGAAAWLLRPAGADTAPRADAAAVLVKPVQGAAVVAAIFGEAGGEPLARRAA